MATSGTDGLVESHYVLLWGLFLYFTQFDDAKMIHQIVTFC